MLSPHFLYLSRPISNDKLVTSLAKQGKSYFPHSDRPVPHMWLGEEVRLPCKWRGTPRFPRVPLCKQGKQASALRVSGPLKPPEHLPGVVEECKQLRLTVPLHHKGKLSTTIKWQSITTFCYTTDFPFMWYHNRFRCLFSQHMHHHNQPHMRLRITFVSSLGCTSTSLSA